VVGSFAFDFYEPAFCRALSRAGANVVELPDRRFFGPTELLRRVQTRFVRGPGVLLARAALVAACARSRPDVVLAWRAPWLDARTVRWCRRAGAGRVVAYNNDDPFGPDRELPIWRAYRRALPALDTAYVYREVNVGEALAHGARRARVLRSSYDPARDRPLPSTDERLARYRTEVVFVGHHETDGRLEVLLALARSGAKLRVAGPGWEGVAARLRDAGAIVDGPMLGDDYVASIQAARVAIVFLSARNRDEYTRRCFEIPAIGTAMIAPRTGEMTRLFEDGREAALFSTPEELVAHARALCADDAARDAMARAGQERCARDGHDVVSRARAWLEDALSLPATRGAP
jgi:hypothetical protein